MTENRKKKKKMKYFLLQIKNICHTSTILFEALFLSQHMNRNMHNKASFQRQLIS